MLVKQKHTVHIHTFIHINLYTTNENNKNTDIEKMEKKKICKRGGDYEGSTRAQMMKIEENWSGQLREWRKCRMRICVATRKPLYI